MHGAMENLARCRARAAKEVDGFRFSPNGSRHIGVLHNGFYYRIAALDEQFEAYHPDAFRQAFEEILSDTHQNKYPVVRTPATWAATKPPACTKP